jgi:prepilin-type N-terminal cleavage/methylation domain-containing protein
MIPAGSALRAFRSPRGFSLTEVLVVCAIAAVFLAGVSTIQIQGHRAYSIGAARVDTQQNARLALDRFMDELRLSSGVTSAANCDNVATGGTSISFAWTNPISGAGETLTYALSGTNLRRTDTTGAQTLIGGVQGLNIWCYQTDGVTLTATAANVYSVVVQIAAQDESVAAQKQHFVVQSRVRLRNI